jgi:serine/threonine protein kinase
VAVKVLHAAQLASLSGTADPEELRRRFLRECRATARIDHPGLVAVHDAGAEGETLCLCMQLAEGCDLADHLAEHDCGPYPWPWAVAVLAQLSSALAAVHAVGIVHRDIKPGNVMVRPDGRLTVLDLGIAAMRGDSSPMSVAFDDPVLRAAGLENDSYGEAKRFFKLTDGQLHEIICYCHFGATVNAATAARHVRAVLTGRQPGMFARWHETFVG